MMKKRIAFVLAMTMAAAAATTASAEYHDYEASDVYVAADEAAVYEGTDEWPETWWSFDCSTGDTSTWAQAGYYFNALMQKCRAFSRRINTIISGIPFSHHILLVFHAKITFVCSLRFGRSFPG